MKTDTTATPSTSGDPSSDSQLGVSPTFVERRGFLRTIGKGSLGALVAVSALARSTRTAQAHYNHYGCCHLWNPHWSGCPVWCGAGHQLRWWGCATGSYLYKCYECTDQADCYHGPFYCSYYSYSYI